MVWFSSFCCALSFGVWLVAWFSSCCVDFVVDFGCVCRCFGCGVCLLVTWVRCLSGGLAVLWCGCCFGVYDLRVLGFVFCA